MSEKLLNRTPLSDEKRAALHEDLHKRPEAAVISRAVMKNGIKQASEDTAALTRLHRTFSVELETGRVTNQRHSGRCWEFATLNTLRHAMGAKYKVKDFELSQNYLFFWDKVERANIFYDNILNTAELPADDRAVAAFLARPGEDGGQWDMAASLVQKYGVVPDYVMPETANTNDSSSFGEALDLKLRKDAMVLRQLVHDGKDETEIAAQRQEFLSEVYRMAAYSFGEPPVSFDLEYRDDEKKYHRDENLTPQAFYDKYFDINFDDYVVLSNAPDRDFNKLYRLPSQENIVGGRPIRLLNVTLDKMKKATIDQLQDGETVWFGNDVLEQMNRSEGLLDSQLYRESELFDVDLSMTKAQRLEYGQANVSHAMTFTGVNLVNGVPNRWKVENSWGEKNGDKGYFVMADSWMNDYVYEVVVNKKYLDAETLAVLDQEPTILPSWDSLA
ncbi:hypothetical protein C5L31_000092 [Secundilactobacillus malefermentans]|uniref:Aminopeptidase n=1 Tax=Secundilactobacillus malefermentans TaxID=176292 RepID=A0A4R5NIP0_9LACO|nr:C1 family peptidase [Secundilactobacillus malefermentans]KRM59902.1 cysteine aminopeptidase [Secundilactobacillus malefermentans DSM 5705 = KCTC 3548]TDG74445.1 hypothetical protein C5L31_000092 [Secundilactobacillus malefermentans]